MIYIIGLFWFLSSLLFTIRQHNSLAGWCMFSVLGFFFYLTVYLADEIRNAKTK